MGEERKGAWGKLRRGGGENHSIYFPQQPIEPIDADNDDIQRESRSALGARKAIYITQTNSFPRGKHTWMIPVKCYKLPVLQRCLDEADGGILAEHYALRYAHLLRCLKRGAAREKSLPSLTL